MARSRSGERAAARERIVLARAGGVSTRTHPAAPAPYWRYWRYGGVALAALLHALVLAAVAFVLPGTSPAQREAERPIPVEIVKPEPEKEKEPEKPKEEAKKEAEKEREEARKKEEEEEEKRKAEEAAREKERRLAEKPAPPPARAEPSPPSRPAPSPPAKAEPPSAPPALPRLLAPPPPPPRALAEAAPRRPEANPEPPPAPERGPDGGQTVADEEAVPHPDAPKPVGVWVLEPLTVDLQHQCGLARISAVMSLTERLGDDHFRGTLRSRIVWARCAPTATVYRVELRISGNAATMSGEGFTDRGVISGNTMMLEDGYGRSVWKKR
jgi:hypothetical protein